MFSNFLFKNGSYASGKKGSSTLVNSVKTVVNGGPNPNGVHQRGPKASVFESFLPMSHLLRNLNLSPWFDYWRFCWKSDTRVGFRSADMSVEKDHSMMSSYRYKISDMCSKVVEDALVIESEKECYASLYVVSRSRFFRDAFWLRIELHGARLRSYRTPMSNIYGTDIYCRIPEHSKPF